MRNPGIDLVRVAGVLAIVAGHIWLSEPAHRFLFAWHVPVFFFLSGYLWKRRPIGFKAGTEIGARSKTLLRPYVLWLVVLLVPYLVVLGATGELTPGRLLGPLWGGAYATRPFTTFWFVFVLFAAAVLWQAVTRLPAWGQSAVVVGALALSIVAGPALAITPLALGTALPALVFVAAGAWARRVEPRLAGRAWLAAALLLFSCLAVGFGAVAPLDIKSGDWGTPVLSVVVAVAISWAMVILAQSLCSGMSPRADSVITGFALCGFTIVLGHPAVLWTLAGADWPRPLVFALAVALPTVVALVGRRTPLSGWVTGAPRVASQPVSTVA